MRGTEHILIAGLLLAGCNPCSEEVLLEDGENYSFDATLDIEGFPLAAGGDPVIDWSGLTTDLLGHPLDPAREIVTMAAAIFEQLDQDQVEQSLADDTLLQSDVTLYVSAYPEGVTSTSVSDLTLMGNDIDVEQYFVEDAGTWMLLLSDSYDTGLGARALAFLEPSESSEATELSVPDGTADLSLDVDLLSLTPTGVPSATPGLFLDWTGLSVNGRGTPWVSGLVDEALVAHYDSLSMADLGEQFKDVEELADELWQLDFSGGSTVDLSPLAEQDPPFEGIDATGTWALALRCSTCANPAPLFFTVLTPCDLD